MQDTAWPAERSAPWAPAAHLPTGGARVRDVPESSGGVRGAPRIRPPRGDHSMGTKKTFIAAAAATAAFAGLPTAASAAPSSTKDPSAGLINAYDTVYDRVTKAGGEPGRNIAEDGVREDGEARPATRAEVVESLTTLRRMHVSLKPDSAQARASLSAPVTGSPAPAESDRHRCDRRHRRAGHRRRAAAGARLGLRQRQRPAGRRAVRVGWRPDRGLARRPVPRQVPVRPADLELGRRQRRPGRRPRGRAGPARRPAPRPARVEPLARLRGLSAAKPPQRTGQPSAGPAPVR